MALYTIRENSFIQEYFDTLSQLFTFYELLASVQTHPTINMKMFELDPPHIPIWLLTQLKVQVYLHKTLK